MLDVKWYDFRAQWPNLRVHMSGRILCFKNGRYLTDDPTEAKHLGKRKGVTLVGKYDRNPAEARAAAKAAAAAEEPKADEPKEPEESTGPDTTSTVPTEPVVDPDTPLD